MTKLSVNLNKVAALRNTRPGSNHPNVLHAAKLCLDAGAHGITVHPRPDQRHIRHSDVFELAEFLKKYPKAEFNIEGNPFIEFMHFIEQVKPTQATLVPDTPGQSTSDHGWDVQANSERLLPVIRRIKEFGVRVSLFMDPNPQHMELAKALGADRVELYTEPYAAAFARGDKNAAEPFAVAARRAFEVGLDVNAGHDLNLDNLPHFLKTVPRVLEVSIGHALIGDALEFGLSETVKKYRKACGASPL
jgi:pyridoxine 5-phosphate synthase